jgi:hypothetical protein
MSLHRLERLCQWKNFAALSCIRPGGTLAEDGLEKLRQSPCSAISFGEPDNLQQIGSRSTVAIRPYRTSTVLAANKHPNRSFTGSSRFCLQPRYRSVMSTDACPRRNWICSISPPAVWHSFAQVLRRSCGARCSSCIRSAHLRTTYQMTFSEMPFPQGVPCRLTALKIRPWPILAAVIQRSTASLTHMGIENA